MPVDERANLARSACRRCREQKLRCSRETPSCERCLRLRAVCEFPPPPDRKLLAASRVQAKRRRVEGETTESPNENHLQDPNSDPSNFSFPVSNDEAAAFEEGVIVNSDIQPSLPLQTLLQEVYFTCMFNSTLVFHRPSFEHAFREKRVPHHVLLAMYACATIFLHPTSSISRQNASLLQPFGDLRALGRKWAVTAGKAVLQDIDQPLFESVQTCQVLTFYWFSAGESQRNVMFSGIAYKAACTLGLDRKTADVSSIVTTQTLSTNPQWLDAEIARRCFWAVWFTQCINSDHLSASTSYNDRTMNLPLPLGKTALNEESQPPSVTLYDVLNQSSKARGRGPASPSILAELMILIMNWTKIRDLIRTRNRRLAKDWLAEVFEIEGRLSAWSMGLPDMFIYSRRNLYEQLVVHQQPEYIFAHALYHQCRLVLHSSLVPYFSGLDLHERLPYEAISLSARIALKSAQGISEIGADLLAFDWDPVKIAPFVGYCLYVSSTIHIALFCSSDASSAAIARTNLISNLKLLRMMKLYWSNLERLWVRINMLYEAQLSRHQPINNEGQSEMTGSVGDLGDLDQLAREDRDTGRLSEALADSVLDYTLRNLRPDTGADTRTGQEFEKRQYPNDLSQLIREDTMHLRPGTQTPLSRFDGQSIPIYNGARSSSDVAWSWDWPGSANLNSAQSNGYQLWQPNLDSNLQPILPYEELFSLDFGV